MVAADQKLEQEKSGVFLPSEPHTPPRASSDGGCALLWPQVLVLGEQDVRPSKF